MLGQQLADPAWLLLAGHMNEWVVVGAVFGGLIGGLIVSWRTWRDVALQLYRHGFDNHLCHRECCR